VDFDADGIDDLISGSYDPGEIYLFRGEGKGKFKARETIKDKSGKPVLRKPDQEISVESFGSWPAMVDWDGDGDLDLLFGGFDGTLNSRVNEGTRQAAAFATRNIVLMAGGKPLQIPDGHCTPVIADWDGDGRWDILSGAATGAVYWFRNVGKPGRPEFAAAVELLPPHKGIGYSEFLDTDEEPRPGIRSQIDVADYNGDGKLDLVVGDFCTYISPRAELSNAERGQVADLRARLERLEPAVAERNRTIREEMKKFWEPIPLKEQLTAEVQTKVRKKQQEIDARPENKAITDEVESVNESLKRYLKPAGPGAISHSEDTPHGYVWLFLRK
jgi:FG-GAP-like repeat